MNIQKGNAIKINISVEEDAVGGFLVSEQNFNHFHHFLEALENNKEIFVVNVKHGDSVYKIGSPFDYETQSFIENDSNKQGTHTKENSEMFAFIADSKLVHIDVVNKQMFPELVAAYLSSPTFSIEEVQNDRQ